MLVKILIIIVLLYLLYQDIRYRSIYWICFPVMLFLMAILGFQELKASDIFHNSIFNAGFLLIQLLLVTTYFSIRRRQLVNITQGLIGWGDVLFLLSITCYLSPLNYIAFYMFSLLVVLSIMLIFSRAGKENLKIPLAGLQALLLAVFLITDWASMRISLNSDYWLIPILNLWV